MKKLLSLIPAVLLGVALVVGASYVSAWTGPSTTSLSNNVPSAINVSAVDQVKSGSFETASSTTVGFTTREVSLRTLSGKAALGTINEIADNLTLLVGNKGVDGRIGAFEYCDQNGENCIDQIINDDFGGLSCEASPFIDTVGKSNNYYGVVLNGEGNGSSLPTHPAWSCMSDVGCVIKQIIYDQAKPGTPEVRVRLHEYYQEPISGLDIWRSTFKRTSVYKNGDSTQNNIIPTWNHLGILDDKRTSSRYSYGEKYENRWSAYDLSARYSMKLYMCNYGEDFPVDDDE